MHSQVRNALLSAILIAVPAGGFALADVLIFPSPPAASEQRATSQGLGDLSAYKDIVSDTQRIALGGDLISAERRITDLETLWDENAKALRQADRPAWTAVDVAADEAFAALRARTPDVARVDAALANLQATLVAPVSAATTQPVKPVAGIAVTDETGRAVPCEKLVGQLRDALAGTTPSAEVADLRSKALERCNADDDARADAFAAEALAKIK